MTIKKSITVNPIIDTYIRKLWAKLVDRGYHAKYSTALNAMLLLAILMVGEWPITDRVREALRLYLAEGKVELLSDEMLKKWEEVAEKIAG